MTTYLHRVVGLYPTRESAESARADLLAQGLDARQLRILQPGAVTTGSDATSDSDDVLKDLLRDGAIGTPGDDAVRGGVRYQRQ